MIEALKKVHWTPAPHGNDGRSVLLSALGIDHGFAGIKGVRPEDLHFCKQIHSSIAIEANDNSRAFSAVGHEIHRPEADALWTRASGVSVAVRTADCLPVLFSGNSGAKVAASHAGWRGLTSGILLNTLAKFKDKNASLCVCIGPAISRERYEVGPEVIEALGHPKMNLSVNSIMLATSKGRQDRWHVDLQIAAALQLIEGGVRPEQIEVIQACTYNNTENWHSYRRKAEGCGSNWAWIRCGI
ncbi:MAG: peptidoglycan editing factor PgeF [Proteobacteria bacterium]|nr:peptidoglycan editing factor PgeF [Pseudomonadota bacterium]